MTDTTVYNLLLKNLLEELKGFYGSHLVTFAVFGSYARADMRPDSDLDLLIIAEALPRGRMKRVDEFIKLEKKLAPEFEALKQKELYPYLAPILKTPEEAKHGSPLFLDMTEELVLLFDRDDFFKQVLDRLRARLRELGSKRVWKGKMWYWILKPDLKPREIIEI